MHIHNNNTKITKQQTNPVVAAMRNRTHVAGQKNPTKSSAIIDLDGIEPTHSPSSTKPPQNNRGLAITVYLILTVGATLNNTRPLSSILTAALLAAGTRRVSPPPPLPHLLTHQVQPILCYVYTATHDGL